MANITSQANWQNVLDKLSEIEICMAEKRARDDGVAIKVDKMYQILVTGNGAPPLPEVVRRHEAYLSELRVTEIPDMVRGHEAFIREQKAIQLPELVRQHEAYITAQKEAATERRKESNKYIYGLVFLALTNGAALLVSFLK